jgi:hypothetical protein
VGGQRVADTPGDPRDAPMQPAPVFQQLPGDLFAFNVHHAHRTQRTQQLDCLGDRQVLLGASWTEFGQQRMQPGRWSCVDERPDASGGRRAGRARPRSPRVPRGGADGYQQQRSPQSGRRAHQSFARNDRTAGGCVLTASRERRPPSRRGGRAAGLATGPNRCNFPLPRSALGH